VVVDDALWVTTRGAPTSHRGGTLALTSTRAGYPRSIDLVPLHEIATEEQILLNDGLVGFKRVGGIEGSELVPNLATSLPRPTEGGTSYTFRLRPDIHYSTGQVVKLEDVRASIERGFKLRSRLHRDLFEGVVGGEACSRRPKAGDLSAGIVTDPRPTPSPSSSPDPTRSSWESWPNRPRSWCPPGHQPRMSGPARSRPPGRT
jgi:ABC-type transport system substrate-binding protein